MATRTQATRLNVDFTDAQKAFLEREKEETGVGQSDLIRRLLDSYMEEPPLLRALRRDRSLSREDRLLLIEELGRRERAKGRTKRRGK